MGCSFGGRKTEWVIDFVEIFGLGFSLELFSGVLLVVFEWLILMDEMRRDLLFSCKEIEFVLLEV
jgi:hypothetical protein